MTDIVAVHTVGSLAARAGGVARAVAALATALTETDVAVELVSGSAADDGALVLPPPALLVPRFVAVQRGPLLTRYPGMAAAIAAAAAAHPGKLPIVHDNGIWAPSNIAVYRAVAAQRLRYVISPHGMLEPWAMAYHAGRKKLAWWAYQRRALAGAAGLLATAEPERAAIRKRFPRTPIAVIANGIDCPALPPATDPASKTVLFMSRLHPKKNLIGLLDAWAVICAAPQFAGWSLEIAGPDEGGHRAEVERHVARLGLDARVSFTGHVEDADKPALFARAAVFILPSFSENFGIVVTEALAAGLPVIATHGTPWDELPALGCGWWVAPTPAALADALQAALALDPAARRAMGEAGHGWVARSFGWDKIAAATASFYRWLEHGGREPDFVDV